MAYEKTTWQNGITPLNADNMNNIENGVSEAMDTAERALAKASGGSSSVVASDIDSESATNGQVLTANGSGGASWQTPSGGGGSTTGAIPEVESIDNPTSDSPSLVLYQGSVYVLTEIEEEEEQTNA